VAEEARSCSTGMISRRLWTTVLPAVAAEMDSGQFDYDDLVKPLEGRMMRSIWRIVRQKEAAEDALQDALAVIWKKRAVVARHPNPEALVLRIAIGAAVDVVRRTRRRLGHEVPGLPIEAAELATTATADGVRDPHLRASVLDAMRRLSARQATAVLLRVIEEQSYEEIAAAMSCSEATARVHVMRGKAALARALAGLHLDPGAGARRSEREPQP
jgi:RNA polymerase sigma factor (sigma-70 family)